jgi:YggT family protein
MTFLLILIHYIFQILSLIIIIDAVLTFFMSPYHPIRQFFDRIVNPLLAPIRRILPVMANIDFSPVVLLIIIQVVDSLLSNLLLSM